MRVLFATPGIPWPLASGAALRRWNILQGLKRVATVDAVVLRRERDSGARAFDGCERVIDFQDSYPGRTEKKLYKSTLGRGLLALSSLLPMEFRINHRRALQREMRARLQEQQYDLVWFETARLALLFRFGGPVPTVLDGDDFAYIRNLGLLRSSPFYGAKLWDYVDVVKSWLWERGLSKRFTFVARCSDEDCALHGARNSILIPNGATVPQVVRRMPECRALFVGLLGYEPNAHGLRWFLDKVWPTVRERVPDAMLDVVGKEPPAMIRRADGRDGVTVHGFIQDLCVFYQKAALSIVPLWAGGGTRIKIIEALSWAVPVLSTSVGAHGIPAAEPQGLERVDAASQFADRCAALLLNPAEAQRRALAGREFMRRRYDWSIVQDQVARLAVHAVSTAAGQRRKWDGARHGPHEGSVP